MKQPISQGKYNLIHISFMLMSLIGFAWLFRHIPDYHFFIKFFSTQSFELAILYSIFSVIKSTRDSKITQLLYELSFTYNIITCAGYWVIVRGHVINQIPRKIFLNLLVQFTLCNDFTHTMPILMMILIHYFENLEYFHRENLKYQIYLMIIATAINVFYTFWDKPVYPFMTYEDISTFFFLVGGFTMITLIFLGMGHVTNIRAKSIKTA